MVLSLPVVLLGLLGGIWVIGLTMAVVYLHRLHSRLTAGTKKERLDEVLEKLISELQQEKVDHRRYEKELISLKEALPDHLQKTGLVRYNSFPGIGGNQSFSLAVLDGRGVGFLMTGLHSREGTRLYTKPIRHGVSQGELSREEQEALKIAQGR